jgi:hypothetical protein
MAAGGRFADGPVGDRARIEKHIKLIFFHD